MVSFFSLNGSEMKITWINPAPIVEIAGGRTHVGVRKQRRRARPRHGWSGIYSQKVFIRNHRGRMETRSGTYNENESPMPDFQLTPI